MRQSSDAMVREGGQLFSHPIDRLHQYIMQLTEEHGGLLEDLRELHRFALLIGRKEEDGMSWTGTLRDLRLKAETFKATLDAHAAWEDDVLFPFISEHYGVLPEQLELMEQEHELAEHFIQAFLDATHRAPVRHYDAQQMAAYLLQAHSILGNHFRLEEELLSRLWNEASEYGY